MATKRCIRMFGSHHALLTSSEVNGKDDTMADKRTTITVPHFVLTQDQSWAVGMAEIDERWAMLDKLLVSEGKTRDEIPEAWKRNPLQAWCWLILTVNEIEFEDDVQKPLVSYGIDMGFSSDTVRRWIWAIS